METFLIVVLVVGLGVYFWFKHFASPETTKRRLLDIYATSERQGAPEEVRLFQMLHARGGWCSLPRAFLLELARRLGNKEKIVEFVVLVERYGLLASKLARIAPSAGPEPEGVSFDVDQVAITLTGLGEDRARRAILGPGFAMVRGEWRPLSKWGAKLNHLLDWAETALSYRGPQDAELALQLALRISSTRSMSSSPGVVRNADERLERREDPATHAFYLAARASGKDLAGMPMEVRRLTPEQAGGMLRQAREAHDAKTVDRNSLTPAGRAVLNAGKCPDCGGLLDSFASGTRLACKWCGTVYPN